MQYSTVAKICKVKTVKTERVDKYFHYTVLYEINTIIIQN